MIVAYDRETMRLYMAERRSSRLASLRLFLGGVCSSCGGCDDLEFDHIDKDTKEFHISGRGLDLPWQRLLDEAATCQLLCKQCHIAKTLVERGHLDPEHGTQAMYKRKGCRCEPCRVAASENRKRWPRAKKSRVCAEVGESGLTVNQVSS